MFDEEELCGVDPCYVSEEDVVVLYKSWCSEYVDIVGEGGDECSYDECDGDLFCVVVLIEPVECDEW